MPTGYPCNAMSMASMIESRSVPAEAAVSPSMVNGTAPMSKMRARNVAPPIVSRGAKMSTSAGSEGETGATNRVDAGMAWCCTIKS